MRSWFLHSAVVAGMLASNCYAKEDPMAGYFGNTLVLSSATVGAEKIRLRRDGTYSAELTSEQAQTGKWDVTDNNTKLCLSPDLPADAAPGSTPPAPRCWAFHGGKLPGDKWTVFDADGQPVRAFLKREPESTGQRF